MRFGKALEAMEDGFKVRRSGWNGKGMWICKGEGRFIQADQFWNVHTHNFAMEQRRDNGKLTEVLPYIIMKTADDKILMGWLASQTDMLADDWEIIDD